MDQERKRKREPRTERLDDDDPPPILSSISSIFESADLGADEQGVVEGVNVGYNLHSEESWRVVLPKSHEYFSTIESILVESGFQIKEDKYPQPTVTFIKLKDQGGGSEGSNLWTIKTGSY